MLDPFTKARAISDWLILATEIKPFVRGADDNRVMNRMIMDNLKRYFDCATEARIEERNKFAALANGENLTDYDIERLRRLERELRRDL
jgi:hypothetical protein